MLELLEKLESSEKFREWKSNNPGYYLSSCFSMGKKNEQQSWQFHYYNKPNDKIVAFDMGKKINIQPESKVFKKKEDIVEPLQLNKVKIDLKQALEKIYALEKYKDNDFTQEIRLLQQVKQPVWNISLLTDTYLILNVKLSAISGKIIHESFESLLNFKSEMFTKDSDDSAESHNSTQS